jgi:hypothetical protein
MHALPAALLACLALVPHLALAQQAARGCDCKRYPFVPAHNYGGEGFDVTTMERKISSIIDMNRDLGTDGTCRLRQNSHMGGTTQKLPAAVESWKRVSRCNADFTSESFDHASKITQDIAGKMSSEWSVGIEAEASGPVPNAPGTTAGGGGSFNAAGSNSKMGKFANEISKTMQGTFVKSTLKCALYQYSLPLYDIPLKDSFVTAVKNLPVSYNEYKYMQFINQYGTHYFHKITLGGRVDILSAANKCVLKEVHISDEEASECLSMGATASVKGEAAEGVSGSGSASVDYKTCNDKAKKTNRFSDINDVFSKRYVQVLGGSTAGLASGLKASMENVKRDYDAWIQSLVANPEVIDQEIRPIFEAFDFVKCSDDNTIPAKKKNMVKAVEAYLYERRTSVGFCKDVCKFNCPGKLEDDCTCKCTADNVNDRDCCPNQISYGEFTIHNLHGHVDADKDGTASDLWMTFPGTYKPITGLTTFKGKPSLPLKETDWPKWGDVHFGKVQAGASIHMQLIDKDGWFNGGDDTMLNCYVKAQTEHVKYTAKDARVEGEGYLKCTGMLTGPRCDQFDEAQYERHPPRNACPLTRPSLPFNADKVSGTCNSRTTTFSSSGAACKRGALVDVLKKMVLGEKRK